MGVKEKAKPGLPAKERASEPTGATKSPSSDAVVGFEEKLWQMADKLRNNMDAAEYKHVVLGLIFLKYISDAFEEKHAALLADRKSGADPEDPDEYRADNIFWVPKEARWSFLQGKAKQPTIGKLIDDAMVAIEAQNPSLKGVLQKDYGRPGLDKTRLTANTKFSDVAMPEKYRLRTGDILFSWSGSPDTSIDTFIWAHGDPARAAIDIPQDRRDARVTALGRSDAKATVSKMEMVWSNAMSRTSGAIDETPVVKQRVITAVVVSLGETGAAW